MTKAYILCVKLGYEQVHEVRYALGGVFRYGGMSTEDVVALVRDKLLSFYGEPHEPTLIDSSSYDALPDMDIEYLIENTVGFEAVMLRQVAKRRQMKMQFRTLHRRAERPMLEKLAPEYYRISKREHTDKEHAQAYEYLKGRIGQGVLYFDIHSALYRRGKLDRVTYAEGRKCTAEVSGRYVLGARVCRKTK